MAADNIRASGCLLLSSKVQAMTLRDRYLQFRKRRAIKKHDTAKYFHIVGLIAKREADKIAKERLKK